MFLLRMGDGCAGGYDTIGPKAVISTTGTRRSKTEVDHHQTDGIQRNSPSRWNRWNARHPGEHGGETFPAVDRISFDAFQGQTQNIDKRN